MSTDEVSVPDQGQSTIHYGTDDGNDPDGTDWTISFSAEATETFRVCLDELVRGQLVIDLDGRCVQVLASGAGVDGAFLVVRASDENGEPIGQPERVLHSELGHLHVY